MTLLYSLTIFSSAFLMFLVQPMICKLLLPHLGGSPALWNTSMMFFQILLLGGYAYAHVSIRLLGARRQVWLHGVLVAAALLWLPVAAKTDLGFASVEHPIGWVVMALFFSVGVPFFVLAANAPLVQSWLAGTNHKDAQNPYFLYSASNIGSLLALGAYPFVIEPALKLSQQTGLWSAGFAGFATLLAACAALLFKHYAPQAANTAAGADPTTTDKVRWVALAFFPSSLLLGVTSYITTDVASMPLFWVIPLALYLVTFILAFAGEPLGLSKALKAQVLLVPLTALALVSRVLAAWPVLILHLLTFFVTALVCHGLLAKRKPTPAHLTGYYLWISFGGMLGGVFNAMVAPQVLTSLIEYPVAMALALLMRPQADSRTPKADKKWDMAVPAMLAALLGAAAWASHGLVDVSALSQNATAMGIMIVVACTGTAMLVGSVAGRPVRFSLSILALFLIAPLITSETTQLYAERNFFGVNRVYHRLTDDSTMLMHGTTLHGLQSRVAGEELGLTSYYTVLTDVFAAAGAKGKPAAVIGLGAGVLACVAKGQHFDFFEIDPAVAAIAQNANYFTFLKDCPSSHTITLGDGRLELAKAEDATYRVVVVDAFSSDAIPMHLLTREAIAMYRKKLAKGGVMAFNISNRHLNLVPVMAAMAKDAGMAADIKIDLEPENPLANSSVWVVMANEAADLAALEALKAGWKPLEEEKAVQVWTDDYSNILDTL